MKFEASVIHEARWSRIVIEGKPGLGRLLSLLQVLEVDSAFWRGDAVLLDLRPAALSLAPSEQACLAAEAARALRRLKKVAFLARAGQLRGGSGIRAFESEADALRWIGGA